MAAGSSHHNSSTTVDAHAQKWTTTTAEAEAAAAKLAAATPPEVLGSAESSYWPADEPKPSAEEARAARQKGRHEVNISQVKVREESLVSMVLGRRLLGVNSNNNFNSNSSRPSKMHQDGQAKA